MKTKRMHRIILGVLLVAMIGLVSYYGIAQSKEDKAMAYNDADVTVTIDKQASENDFEDIKDMLSDYGINAKFSEIKRNDLDELTAIRIELKDQSGGTSVSQISGNLAISEITFGRKEGQLFVGQNNQRLNMFAFFNDGAIIPPQMEMDSLFSNRPFTFQQFSFDDFFNNNSSSLKALRERIDKFFEEQGNTTDPFTFFFDNENDGTPGNTKFRFKDDPNTDKLIIIDGKESDFTTLDTLAKEDKLETVDMLQPNTAISIYGERAKDGAIIVTTKE